ncbi:hypothetical protein HHK36_002745 [Tetracentron sinense]|uniref:Uncharacterized protein n=1 Tax=Tetracentron sinense TaxID=13715 RepID=A0A835DRV9_TETSI|nr:hypothetical protein HHK36_002745 [Tetracentron sinense]
MAMAYIVPNPRISNPYLTISARTHVVSSSSSSMKNLNFQNLPLSPTPLPNPISAKTHLNSLANGSNPDERNDEKDTIPTMSEIMDSSKSQNLHIHLQTLGPFFRITVTGLETKRELGKAEGLIRIWLGGRILHLDSIRLQRETLSMERSIFGIGLFVGAVAVRHGYDCGCRRAELLAINDSDLYHSKLVRFYTRIGFKAVHEVTGSSIQDFAHMLVWGGKGTRMEANVEQLLVKWCTRFKSRN